MVFVHSRKETGKTGRFLAETSQARNYAELFSCENKEIYALAKKEIQKSRNREMAELFSSGGFTRRQKL